MYIYIYSLISSPSLSHIAACNSEMLEITAWKHMVVYGR